MFVLEMQLVDGSTVEIQLARLVDYLPIVRKQPNLHSFSVWGMYQFKLTRMI